MTSVTKYRTSASLILVAPPSTATSGKDYNLLMLKRSDATAIVQNQCVFPGGMLDNVGDESVAWLEYFDEFGVPEVALRRLVLISDHRPGLLAPQGNGCYDRFFKRTKIWAREIILRLTALRECFEEVGILLCRTREQLAHLNDEHLLAQFQQNFDRDAWQRRVHNKPSEFLDLCRELKVVPDLWALQEWCAWASPAIIKKGHETAFFMAFVNTQPSLHVEPSEVKECLWRTPKELLTLYHLGELWFLPPQIYELSRLQGIKDYKKLHAFAVQRSKLGTTLFLPVVYSCSDSLVYALPGDEFYVPEPHLVSDVISFPGTASDLRSRSKRIHRYEYKNQTAIELYLNFEAPNGHLPPQKFPFELHKL
ncbi:acyl-coenzyme A diphosphatase NUDT19 [Drosophila albomicans]|uniref:Acyl-coenzyme A diphosphatase NUDT19 n=1 Tax=Drosophila albomicans TaxID=7291 RepID=A0A6P8W6E1_DROAB|nr:acyl-coenzyme A diphosphatase NUDT19 [Drosophila albomicans]